MKNLCISILMILFLMSFVFAQIVPQPNFENTNEAVVKVNENNCPEATCYKLGRCYPYFHVKDGEYCSDIKNRFIPLLKSGEECVENLECETNLCENNLCIINKATSITGYIANDDTNINNDVDEDDDDLNEVGERVCCKVYGLGSRMKQVNVRYGWTTENNCVTPEGFVGGEREIVEDKYCELKTQYPTRILTQAQVQKAIQTKNRLRIQAQEGECPENCICSGSTIKCELNGTRQMTITAGKSGNTIVQVKGINMSTNVTLYKSEGKFYGTFANNQTKEIKIFPDEIKERIKERIKLRLEDEDIELDEDGIYQIQGRKRARLFFLFPVREKIRAQIDSETGEMIKIRNPWWGFLARDIEEETEEEEEEGNESEEIEE